MILTVTPNPAVDQTIWVRTLHPGVIHRFQRAQLDPAGKGVNVSRMVSRLGWPTLAMGLLAGEVGRAVEERLEDEGVQHCFVRVPGQTRINVTVVEELSGVSTHFYGAGPVAEARDLKALEGVIRLWLPAARVLVLAGSLPVGAPVDQYARWIELARGQQVKVVLDADDGPLIAGLEARPFLIKPNVAEAERALGRSLPDLPSIAAAARELARRWVSVAVISMGKEGAVCATRDRGWIARPPAVQVRSQVGSGDSLVAGLAVALARGDPAEEGLRLGTAAGAATAAAVGTELGSRAEVERLAPRVVVEALV